MAELSTGILSMFGYRILTALITFKLKKENPLYIFWWFKYHWFLSENIMNVKKIMIFLLKSAIKQLLNTQKQSDLNFQSL